MNSQGMIFGERRQYDRKACSRLVEINDYRSIYEGHMRNLTNSGAFIEPNSSIRPSIGQEISVTIPYGLKHRDVTIKAKIAWVTSGGIGIRFMNATAY